MATRKNMIHKGASARAGRPHADKHMARYLRKQTQQPKPQKPIVQEEANA